MICYASASDEAGNAGHAKSRFHDNFNPKRRLFRSFSSVCLLMALSLFLDTLHAESAKAELVYVAPDGNDARSGKLPEAGGGTTDGPLATLDAARKIVRQKIAAGLSAPVTVLIRGGEYPMRETVVFTHEDSGTEAFPITYKACAGETPVFTGGLKLTDWKPVGSDPKGVSDAAKGKLWVAEIPAGLKGKWQITSLYDGTRLLPRSRSGLFTVSEKHQQDGANAQPKDTRKHISLGDPPVTFARTITYNGDDLKAWDNIKDIEIYMRPKHGWLINLLPLESIDPASKTAQFTVEPTYGFAGGAKQKYQVDNAIDHLDEPGEWCFNSLEGRVYLWPESPPAQADIRAPYLREFILLTGVEDREKVRHLNFEGLTFRHGLRDTWMPGDKGLQHDWEMYDKGNAVLRMRHAEHNAVRGCVFEASSGGGVRLDLYCQHNTVESSTFAHLGSTGILLSGYGPGLKDENKFNTIHNNHLHHVGTIYRHATGIFIAQSGHNLIDHNTIHDLAYNGMVISGCRPHELMLHETLKNRREWVSSLRVGEIKPYVEAIQVELAKQWLNSGVDSFEALLHARNNRIEDNEIYRVMLELHDGNGIYFSGMGRDNIAERNYIHDTHTTMGFIRLDDNSGFTTIRNNVFLGGRSMLQIKWACAYVNNFAIDVADISGREWHPLDLQQNVFYNRNDPKADLVRKDGWSNAGKDKTFVGFKSAANSIFWMAKRTQDFETGRDYMAPERRGGAPAGMLFVDPMFDEAAFAQKIFRFKPGSPAGKLGIQPIDLSGVGSSLAP